MKIKLFLVGLFCLSFFMVSCGEDANEETQEMDENYIEDVNEETQKMDENYISLKSEVVRLQAEVDGLPYTVSSEEYFEIVNDFNKLEIPYYDETDKATVKLYERLETDMKKLTQSIYAIFTPGKHDFVFNILNREDYLMGNAETLPVYLHKGETLVMEMDFEKKMSVVLYNNDSQSEMKRYKKVTEVRDSMTARYSAIYLIELLPNGRTYTNVSLTIKSEKGECISNPMQVSCNTEDCEKKDFRAVKIEGIEMNPLFEEPKKFTLRGQLKAMFSGSSRALVALQVPKGTKDLLYSLRVSTNETASSSDGEFYSNMDLSYRNIRFMGLPVYESKRGVGLISTILGENVPPREEDAYINMYVIMNADDARKFQNGALIDQVKYNLDYSTVGTQSCNGRIPVKGQKTIYLGFENERMRYNNYVWLEVIGSMPKTSYVREVYVASE